MKKFVKTLFKVFPSTLKKEPKNYRPFPYVVTNVVKTNKMIFNRNNVENISRIK